jgi:putative polyketide hydroxylase
VAPYLGTEGMQEIVDDWSMEIGYRYNSAAVALESDPHPPTPTPAVHEHPRESKGRPGSRAPHIPVQRSGTPLSTLDLFGTAFVLLAGPGGQAWHEAAAQAARVLEVPLEAYVVGGDELHDPGGLFSDAYGISAAGAVLVRPDGFVAWRARDATGASRETVHEVLEALLLRQRDAPSQAAVSTNPSH